MKPFDPYGYIKPRSGALTAPGTIFGCKSHEQWGRILFDHHLPGQRIPFLRPRAGEYQPGK